ncbi:MAG: HD domain-containing protein [Pyramidobacter sp.]|nr:HD domain-containing protein [Pyramidobacter sp.]
MISASFFESVFPALALLPEDLRASCVKTWQAAAQKGNHTEETFSKVLFAESGLKNCPVSLINHTCFVTETAMLLTEQFNRMYSPAVNADMNTVIAAALLHDAGKACESFASDPDGTLAQEMAVVRHPFAGAVLARDCGCPWKVCHIIANHSFEGDKCQSFPELFIVRRADMTHFEYLFFGYERRYTPKNS